MEVWRAEVIEGRRPEVLSRSNLVAAFVIHIVAFAVCWIVAAVQGLFTPKETIVPIDLTVVVNENLDGNETEPPPLQDPPPPPPPQPRPRPRPQPSKVEPPKALEQIVTNVVKQVEKKDPPKKDPSKKDPPKKEEPKKEEPPKKTKAELERERIARMRNRAVTNKKPVTIKVDAPSGNGRTERQTRSEAEIRNLLNNGYVPGTRTQLATSEQQRCISLIKAAIEAKWNALSPKVGQGGTVVLRFSLSSNGGLINVVVSRGSGDPQADLAARQVASQVTHVAGLSPEFIAAARKEGCLLNYTVRGR